MDGIDFTGLEELGQRFNKALEEFPENRRELHKTAADIMYNNVMNNISNDVKEDSGNLKKGQKKVIGSGGGYAAVRPDYRIAPHTHLIESGHKVMRKDKNGNLKQIGFVNGKHMYERALVQSEPGIIKEAEALASKVVEVFK